MCLLQETTTVFDTRQMITDRKVLEETMFAAVRERLGGTCCRQVCSSFAYDAKTEDEAEEIREQARAQAAYTVILETARSEGLKAVFNRLSVTDQKYKSSFDYLRTLRGLNHTHLTVDFQQLITGNF